MKDAKIVNHAVDTILSQRNWLIGYRIAEEEIDGSDRAEYGANIIKKLSKELSAQYGKGYDCSNFYHCLRFYKEFPQIVDTACRQYLPTDEELRKEIEIQKLRNL